MGGGRAPAAPPPLDPLLGTNGRDSPADPLTEIRKEVISQLNELIN